MTAPDYRRIAEQAVDLLCSVGSLGLDRSQQRRLWQEALNLDRQLHPHRPAVTVWTEAEGDINPPRKADSIPVPADSTDEHGVVTITATETSRGNG